MLCRDADVAADAPLMDSGLDSLGAVEFRSSLEARLSVQLPPTLVFDYPSLSAIAGYLDTMLAEQQGTSTASSAAAAAEAAATATAHVVPAMAPATGPARSLSGAPQLAMAPVIAVLATHGRFPEPDAAAVTASASGLAGKLSLRDCISVVPAERYDVEMQLTEDLPARFGGFVAGAQVRRDCADAFDCSLLYLHVCRLPSPVLVRACSMLQSFCVAHSPPHARTVCLLCSHTTGV